MGYGDGILCSFPKGCRLFEWGFLVNRNPINWLLSLLKKKREIVTTGGEDRHFRVFKWPCLVYILDESNAHAIVKDLHFGPNGKFLMSLGDGGSCKVWGSDIINSYSQLAKER